MSSMSRRVGLAAMALLVAACTEQSPSRPLEPTTAVGAQGPAPQAALEAQINSLINALYAPSDQGNVFRDFAQIKAQIASGRTADAQASIIAFVGARLAELESGDVLDPNGTQPPSTADAFRDLLNSVATFGGLPAPIPPSNPLGGDGAVAVVGPAGGTVVTSTGFGGVQFPAGALPQDVIVVVERLPNPTVPNTGPLPTTLAQYPLFYDVSTTPPFAQLAQPVTVAMGQLEVGQAFGPPTQAVADRLQIAHPNPASPTTVELLERVAAPFLDCAGVSLARGIGAPEGRGILARALTGVRGIVGQALGVFRPTPAYAVHGGLGGKTTSFSPFGAVDPSPFVMISAGDQFACGITVDGAAYCWGLNTNGQLGDGTITNRLRPVRVSTTESFNWIGAGSTHACALTTTNQARCWGGNIGGQLGDGTTTDRALPVPVTGGHTFTNLSVGSYLVCGVTSGGPTWCWGAGGRTQGTVLTDFGALGAPAPSICTVGAYAGPQWPCSTNPIQVITGLTFASVSVGTWFACGVTASGSAHCWGWGNFFNLGNGSFTDAPTPTPVSGALTFQTVETGALTSCGTVAGGTAYCWGGRFFNYGQLGGGTENPNPTPGLVVGGVSFRSVRPAKGNSIHGFTCGVTPTDQAWCWGANMNGELGTLAPMSTCAGSIPCVTAPVPVSGGLLFKDVRGGAGYACGVTTAGVGYCWGQNFYGQLGDGSTTNSPVPKRVLR